MPGKTDKQHSIDSMNAGIETADLNVVVIHAADADLPASKFIKEALVPALVKMAEGYEASAQIVGSNGPERVAADNTYELMRAGRLRELAHRLLNS
jgi:hypothetical protein